MRLFSLRTLATAATLGGILWGCSTASTAGGDATPAPVNDSTAVSQSDDPADVPLGRPNVDVVTSEDIRRQIGQPLEIILAGRVSGVSVFRSGDGIAVRIRGPSSFMSSNEPLYVVDGTPVQPGPGGALRGISPYDIESIRVLKDPVDTSLYGVRGSNGVIVVTTTRPGR